jgi:RimJ/RimL family protein N-acetyltransferase
MNQKISLVPIDREGNASGYTEPLNDIARDVQEVTVNLYRTSGFEEPWICYWAFEENQLVGTCGFKSGPRDGKVEIAYFTFPQFEERGIASAMAAQLVDISLKEAPGILVTAQTLAERNASHRILEKLGFQHCNTIDHPEDGLIWEWQLIK